MEASLLPYAAAFSTGLFGSAHCLGMCGPLVSAFFLRPGASPAVYLVYHLARLAVYALFGFAAAALGATLASTGQVGMAQSLLQIFAGLVILLLGFELLGLWQLRLKESFPPLRWLGQCFALALRQGPLRGATLAGALNGFMPCSMTMAIASRAASLPSPVEGMLLLLSFGVGTLPSMLSASWLLSRLGARMRGWLLKAAGLLVIAMGLHSLWLGGRYFWVLYRLLY